MQLTNPKSRLMVLLLVAASSWAAPAAVYKEVNGVVCVEAEHFDSRAKTTDEGDDHAYVLVPDEGPATGTDEYLNPRGGKYMQVQPEGGQNRNTLELQASGPYIDYKVEITTTGEYQLYLRGIGYDGGADSYYARILEIATPGWYRYSPDPNNNDFDTLRNDNADPDTAIGWNGYAAPEVNSGDGGEEKALFNITTAGTYTVRFQQREDSNAIDAFVLQLSSKPPPTADIPESPTEGVFILVNKQPADVIVGTGGTATLTVDASGSAVVTYQWQKAAPGSSAFTDVAGATSTSITTGALTPADNGTKYRATLSIPGKSVTTREALVTVDVEPPKIITVNGSPNLNAVTVAFSEPVTAATGGNAANYSISGLVISDVTLSPNGRTATLKTGQQTSGTKYTLTVKAIVDIVTPSNKITPDPTTVDFTAAVLTSGAVGFEAYNNITGTAIDGLTAETKFPDEPDFVSTSTALDTRPVYPNDSHENYGGRLRTILTPAETADYDFFLRSDDASQLYFNSTDDSFDAAKLELIAEETGCCDAYHEAGNGDPETTQAPIHLTAGRKYAMQVLWKEGGGGDYAQVAWRKAGDATPASALTPIPGKFLSWYVSPDVFLDITQQPTDATVAANAPATFSVRYTASSFRGSTADIQWQKAASGSSTFADIPGATGQDYTIPFADPTDDGAKFRAVVSVGSLASKNSAEATLHVSVETSPPTVAGAGGSVSAVNVSFSEPLDAASAANKSNYSIDGGITVNSATVVSGANEAAVVRLEIAGAVAGKCYAVGVSGVKDRSNNVIASAAKATFVANSLFYDFNAGAPGGTKFYPPAVVLPDSGVNGSGVLLLTPAVGSSQGAFVTESLSGSAVDRFTANFKLYIGNGSGNPADGLSFNVANDLPDGTTGEEGTGSGIIVAFDTYDNGGGEAPAIDIKYAGQEVVHTVVTKASLVNNKFVDVTIRLNAGKLDVIHDGKTIHDQVVLPDFAPISDARIMLGARTGGEWERHLIDDFGVVVNAEPEICAAPPENPKFTSIQISGANIVIEWTGGGILQAADDVTGPWADVTGASSPFTTPIAGTRKFARIKR
ncbi:MAG: hypothetical protein L0Z50_35125 [Verrucomicrobiales bacterium]|nr:hypothetical protein [Verrucomicrobiales bacterium]